MKMIIQTLLMCVFIPQWLAAESSDCSREGSEGSHHHSWPRGPRCDLPPDSTLGVFLGGRRNGPSFHLENETKTATTLQFSNPEITQQFQLSEDADMLLAGIMCLIWYWTCHYNMCLSYVLPFFMLEENTSSRSQIPTGLEFRVTDAVKGETGLVSNPKPWSLGKARFRIGPSVPHSKSSPTANPWTRKLNLKWNKCPTLGRAKGNKTWNEAADVCPSLTPPDVFLNPFTKRFIQIFCCRRHPPLLTSWLFFYLNLLTFETFTSCISETSYLLIKHGVSWRVFGVCFLFFSSGASPQVSEGDFQDSWIICSETLGIGFVSSAERPRRCWSDASVCYRSYFVEAVHLRVLLVSLKAASLSVWRSQSFVNLPGSPGNDVFVDFPV